MKISGKSQKLISFLLAIGVLIPSFLLLPTQKVIAQEASDDFFTQASQEQAQTGPTESNTTINTADVPKAGSTDADALTNKGCAQLLGSQFAKLFGKKAVTTFKDEGVDKGLETTSVLVFSESINLRLGEIKTDTSETKSSTGYLMKKGGCLDSIAKIIIKNMIGYITESLINWINTGFEGKPFYLENPEGFFKDIAKNEFLAFGNSIKDPALFPFGRNFLAGAAQAFKGKFEANAQYSLNRVVAQTNPGKLGVDFNADFNVGGWDAYLGMTVPQNNPIGFNMMAAQELSIRLEGTKTSKANQIKESLQQAGGFLGDERCADPITSPKITHAEDAKARAGVEGAKMCNRWEYVTPGKLISDKLTNSANSPEKRLEIADDLNSALAALADALISKGITTLTNDGLRAMGKSANTENFNYADGVTNNPPSQGSGSGTQFPDFYVTPGSWIADHPDFNLATDLTQAIVDEQKTYLDKLKSYSNKLNQLIKDIYQLDYCIPGPHPGWEDNSRTILNDIIGKIPTAEEELAEGMANTKTIVGIGNKLLDPIGVGPTGAILDWAVGQSEEKKVKKYYAGIVGAFTGRHVTPDGSVATKQQTANILNTILDRYIAIIHNIFNLAHMPGVTQEAAAEFKKIPGYQKIIEKNDSEIIFRASIIKRLEVLKEKIDNFNSQVDPEDPQIIAEFARLSAYFVNGDDIANIDSLYKEAEDARKYVYNGLLKGPGGCENDLEAGIGGAGGGLPWQVYDTKRMTYPFPIHYNYNDFTGAAGGPRAILPDPENSGYANKMKGDTSINQGGLGFLSFIAYDINFTSYGVAISLDTWDLFNHEEWNASVGKNAPQSGSSQEGAFEAIIGIY